MNKENWRRVSNTN